MVDPAQPMGPPNPGTTLPEIPFASPSTIFWILHCLGHALVDNLDVLERLVLVEVPESAVVAVREPVLGHPVLLAAVAATFRHDAGHQRRRSHVELQPLLRCTRPAPGAIINTSHSRRKYVLYSEGSKNVTYQKGKVLLHLRNGLWPKLQWKQQLIDN